uniref:Uncharacterized protein n=1 Tax=Romanomermis culicivorax TaxID=13658 RepID=A0A915KVP8_ROMCU
MPKEIKDLIKVACFIVGNNPCLTSAQIRTMSADNLQDNYIKFQDIKLLLKVIAAVCPLTKLFLSTTCDNLLEEILEEERVSFCDDKSDTFCHIEKIKAEQSVRHPQPSLHQLPTQGIEVTKLDEPIFLMAQASVSISPNHQQWVTDTVFPLTSTTIPDLIVQPLPNNQVATEFPIETAIVYIANGMCPL